MDQNTATGSSTKPVLAGSTQSSGAASSAVGAAAASAVSAKRVNQGPQRLQEEGTTSEYSSIEALASSSIARPVPDEESERLLLENKRLRFLVGQLQSTLDKCHQEQQPAQAIDEAQLEGFCSTPTTLSMLRRDFSGKQRSSGSSTVRTCSTASLSTENDNDDLDDSEHDLQDEDTTFVVSSLLEINESSECSDEGVAELATLVKVKDVEAGQGETSRRAATRNRTTSTSSMIKTRSRAALSEHVAEQNQDDECFWNIVKDRAGWLIGLLLLQSLSSFIIRRNETLLQNHLVIIQFLTMLVGAGGNAGNQTSVRVIRGLAVGTVHNGNLWFTIKREVQMGVLLATVLAISGWLRAYVFNVNLEETVAITSSLWLIVFISIVLGVLLPLLMKFVRIDPAHSSTTIQVVMDILGVTITVHACALVMGLMDVLKAH